MLYPSSCDGKGSISEEEYKNQQRQAYLVRIHVKDPNESTKI